MHVTGVSFPLVARNIEETYAFYTKKLLFRGGYFLPKDGICAVALGPVCLTFRQGASPASRRQHINISIEDVSAYRAQLQPHFADALPEVELDIPGVLSFDITDPSDIRLSFTQPGSHLREPEHEFRRET